MTCRYGLFYMEEILTLSFPVRTKKIELLGKHEGCASQGQMAK